MCLRVSSHQAEKKQSAAHFISDYHPLVEPFSAVHVIEKKQIPKKLLEACPSFKAVYDASDEQELDYMIAGEFARYLLGLYISKQLAEFSRIAQMIELFHVEGDDYVKEYATIGLLESIQNIWGNQRIDPENFAKWLLPVSLQHWHELTKFWNGITSDSK